MSIEIDEDLPSLTTVMNYPRMEDPLEIMLEEETTLLVSGNRYCFRILFPTDNMLIFIHYQVLRCIQI